MSAYSSVVLADAPVVYYRLGEASGTTMTDSSGNGHNGTYNGVTLGATGLITGDSDTAGSFNGSAFGTHPAATFLAGSLSAFSVEAWINTSATGYREIAALWTNSSNRTWEFRVDTGGKLAFVKINGSTNAIGTTVVRDGTRRHVAATYDGANIRLYVNGALDNTVAATGTLNSGSTDLKIGEREADLRFSGTIDEVAIYTSVLSGARILEHYNTGITQPITISATSPKVTSSLSADYSEVGSVAAVSPLPTVSLSADYMEPLPLTLAASSPLATVGLAAQYDPEPVLCTLNASLPMPEVSMTASRRVFIPPTTTESSGDILFGRFGIPVGQSVVLTDGHYVTTPYPWLGEIADLEEGVEWFQGGRTYDIDSPTASALQADGYTLTEV